MKISIKALADKLGGQLTGDPEHVIDGCATLESATADHLSFIYNKKYKSSLKGTKAGVVILSSHFIDDYAGNAIIVENPYLAYAKAATFITEQTGSQGVIHPSACISKQSFVDASCFIGAHVVIGDNVTIGSGGYIGPGSVIQNDVVIGENSKLVANVVIEQGTVIGNNVIINPSAVVGSDGFGYAPDPETKGWYKIPQLGRVVIGNNVEIGASTTIDRGALEDTVIGNGVKIDNQVMIAHNVVIGDHTAIAGCVGIAGSAKVGNHCTLAGGVGLVGHITIADGVHVTGMTMVTHSIKEAGAYSSGTPFQKNGDWLKNAVRFKYLDKLTKKVNSLTNDQKDS